MPINVENRQHWMSVLARAESSQLQSCWQQLPELPEHDFVRAPEIGLAMVKGRISGTGSPFSLGEMTLTRCTVRMENGKTGFGYIQGRNKKHAEQAAVLDALLQDQDWHDKVMRLCIEPLHTEWQQQQQNKLADAEKTRVDFFTLVRGE